MSSKHTRGPWTTRNHGNFVYDQTGRVVAIMHPSNGTREELDEIFANARLIATAPDLAKELESTLETAIAYAAEARGETEEECAEYPWARRARSVLARARSE